KMELSYVIDGLKPRGIYVTKRLDIINGIACHLSDTEESFIRSLPFVRYIEPDDELYRLEEESPEHLFAFSMFSQNENIDWGVKRINAPDVWNIATGKGVKVGIIDTGISTKHPDLLGAVAGGYDAVNGLSYEDDNDHGTYVASVISARRNDVGIVGVAPDAMLYAVKVMGNDGRGYISDVLDGCQWVIKEGLRVVNMSLGSNHQSKAIHEAMDALTYNKVITVVATGNEGKLGVYSPARDNITICVGGSSMDDSRMSWSNYGPELKGNGVLAPGDWIQVADKSGGWRRVAGTSIATPHVTGIVALLLEIGCKDPELIRKFVFSGASQSNNPNEFNGHGLVNAKKTLEVMSVNSQKLTP
ncbi:MAG: Peptidase protein, partial [Candidatus Poribacteria bacterium]|nr:Peptidase protein [Candidatus Poribacteria bacterium]